MLLQALCSISYPLVNSNWSYSPETPNLGQIRRFLEPCDLEIWRMTLKKIGHLFYATSSFVQHFIAIGEFKLELQSGNAQSGSNSAILAPCDLEIWRMTLKNDRAPLLSNIKLYVSFHHHMWIQTGVTVRKRKFVSWPLWPWPLTLTFCMDLTLDQCDNTWKFHDDTMMGT